MSVQPSIRIPERGFVDIDVDTFKLLESQEAFWRLIAQRILSFSQPSRHFVRLAGSCFVGRVHLGELSLEIGEKIEGALGSLLDFATFESFRVERQSAPASDFGTLIELLVRQFLELLHLYVSNGRSFEYENRRFQGALAGGRINIIRTIGLRARGLRDQLAFDRPTLTRATLENRIYAAALIEIGRIAQVAQISESSTTRTQALSLVFEDCRDSTVLQGSRPAFVNAAQRMLVSSATKNKDLLTLASLLLSRQSLEFDLPSVSVAPRAWFLNLESLFEIAVRKTLKTILVDAVVSFRESETEEGRIFPQIETQYNATPDLIIWRNSKAIAVGDVKYKEWDGWAPHSDIYQLLVHTAAYASPISFLIYPDQSFRASDLGPSATGSRTWVFAVNVADLENDLRRAMELMSTIKGY